MSLLQPTLQICRPILGAAFHDMVLQHLSQVSIGSALNAACCIYANAIQPVSVQGLFGLSNWGGDVFAHITHLACTCAHHKCTGDLWDRRRSGRGLLHKAFCFSCMAGLPSGSLCLHVTGTSCICCALLSVCGTQVMPQG